MSSPQIQLSEDNKNNMRFRSLALVSVFLIACGSAAATKEETPIKTDTPPSDVPTTDPVADPVVDSGSPDTSTPVVDSGPKVPANQAECVAACETKYPVPAAQNHQLDSTCFLGGVCEHVCNGLVPGGQLFPVSAVDPDSGVLACPIGEGTDPIVTLSQDCSNCIATEPSCCKLWVDIFGSVAGRDLNKCAVKCFTDFKN